MTEYSADNEMQMLFRDDEALNQTFLAAIIGIKSMDCFFSMRYKLDNIESSPDYDSTKKYSLGKRE